MWRRSKLFSRGKKALLPKNSGLTAETAIDLTQPAPFVSVPTTPGVKFWRMADASTLKVQKLDNGIVASTSECPLHAAMRVVSWQKHPIWIQQDVSVVRLHNLRCTCDMSRAVVPYMPVVDPKMPAYYTFTAANRLGFGARRAVCVLVNDSDKYRSMFEQACHASRARVCDEVLSLWDLVSQGYMKSSEMRVASVCESCHEYNPVRVTINPLVCGPDPTYFASNEAIDRAYAQKDFTRVSSVCFSCESRLASVARVNHNKEKMMGEYKLLVVDAVLNAHWRVDEQIGDVSFADDLFEKCDKIIKAANISMHLTRTDPRLNSLYARAVTANQSIVRLLMAYGLEDIESADIGGLLDRAYDRSLEEEDCDAVIAEPSVRPALVAARSNPVVLREVLMPVLAHNYDNLRTSPSRGLVYRADILAAMTPLPEDEGEETVAIADAASLAAEALARHSQAVNIKAEQYDQILTALRHGFRLADSRYVFPPLFTHRTPYFKDAWLVAESDTHFITWEPNTAVCWSRETVPYSSIPLPFDTWTSPPFVRSFPGWDHRWLGTLGGKYHALHIPANTTLPKEYVRSMPLTLRAPCERKKKCRTCGSMEDTMNGECAACYSRTHLIAAPDLYVERFHDPFLSLDALKFYITDIVGHKASKDWATDKFEPDYTINDIYYSCPSASFCGAGHEGESSLVVRLNHGLGYEKGVIFPFDVYVDWSLPHKDLTYVSYYVRQLHPSRVRIPAGTLIAPSSVVTDLFVALNYPPQVIVYTFAKKAPKPNSENFCVPSLSMLPDVLRINPSVHAQFLAMKLFKAVVSSRHVQQYGVNRHHFGDPTFVTRKCKIDWEETTVEAGHHTTGPHVPSLSPELPAYVASFHAARALLVSSMPGTFVKHLDQILTYPVFRPAFRAHTWCHHLSASDYQDDTAHVVAESDDWLVVWHPSTLTLWSKDCVVASRVALPFPTECSYPSVRSIPTHDHRWLEHPASGGKHYAYVPAGIAPDLTAPEWQLHASAGLGKYNGKPHKEVTCGCSDNPSNRFNWDGKDICRDCFMKALLAGKTPASFAGFMSSLATRPWAVNTTEFLQVSPYITDLHPSFGDVEDGDVRYGSVMGRNPTMYFGQHYSTHGSKHASIWLSPRPGTTSARMIQFPFPVFASTHDDTRRSLAGIEFKLSVNEPGYQRFDTNAMITLASFAKGFNPVWLPSSELTKVFGITCGPLRRHTWITQEWKHYEWTDGVNPESSTAYFELLGCANGPWYLVEMDPRRAALVQRQCGVNMFAGEFERAVQINAAAARHISDSSASASLLQSASTFQEVLSVVLRVQGLVGVSDPAIRRFAELNLGVPTWKKWFSSIMPEKTKGAPVASPPGGPASVALKVTPSIHQRPLLDFYELREVGPSSVAPPETHRTWIPMGWRIEQGLPYFELEDAYRGQETSLLRSRENRGLHWLADVALPEQSLSPLLLAVVKMIESAARKASGRIVITANPDGPPPPASLGFFPVAINGKRSDWHNIPLALPHPRMNAMARLLVMMTNDDVKEYWIVNGREVERQVLPSLIPGRLHTFNRFDLVPLVLYSTRSDLKFRDPQLFQSWFDLSWAYGTDEKCLADYPLTASLAVSPRPLGTWLFPRDPCWPDVELLQGTSLIFKGALNRLTAPTLFRPKDLVVARPRRLGIDQRYNIARIEEGIQDIEPIYLSSIFDHVTDRADTLLVAVYGTRGDIVPIEYLVRVLMLLGAKVVMFKTAQLDAAALADVVAGNFKGQILNAISLFGLGRTGFKAVLTPQLAVPGVSASFELTPWEFTDPVPASNFMMGLLVNAFIKMKTPALKIGIVQGSNVPRSADGKRMLLVRSQGPRPERRGWVAGSDGPAAVPEWVKKIAEEITSTDHHDTAFVGYTHVYCTGGQGIMQTLRARDVIPIVYAPGFDRTLNLPCDAAYLAETDFSHLVRVVEDLGVVFGPQMSYSYRTRLRRLIPRLTLERAILLPKLALFLYNLQLPVNEILKLACSFPVFILVAKTGFFDIALFVVWFLFTYPAATSFTGTCLTLASLAAIEALCYYSKLTLQKEHPTYLTIQLQKKFPHVQHMRIIDTKADEVCHMQFQGSRQNLINPFRGVIEKGVPAQAPLEVRIPVAVNYPVLRDRLLTKASAYAPWFNCHVVLPDASSYDFIITSIVILVQCWIFPLTFVGYSFWAVRKLLNPAISDLPADDFFRFGNEDEYGAIDKQEEDAKRQEALLLELSASVAGAPVPPLTAAISASARATVIVEEQEDEQAFMPPKPSSAIAFNPAFDEDHREQTLLSQALEELRENGELYSLDDFVLHAAILAEGAKEQGMPDDFAYHGAVLALHDFVMSYPVPDEVSEWRRKFSPVRSVRNVNEYLTRLSNFIKSRKSCLPRGVADFLYAFYLWLEGLGAKLKTHAIKVYHVLNHIADRLSDISQVLWEEFSALVMPMLDFLFGGKMSKRIKAVWALGGVARNPSISKQKRLQEMYAFASYERHQGFNTAYAEALADVVSHLPTADQDARLFPASKYKDNVLKVKTLKSAVQEEYQWLLKPREQFRPANAPSHPVMSANEALAAYLEKDETDQEALLLRDQILSIEAGDGTDAEKTDQVNRVYDQLAAKHSELADVKHDAYLSRQVARRLDSGAKQTVDHVHEVKRHPATMFEMQERYAYLGLEYDPKEERIPDTFDSLTEERKALYDSIARAIVAKWPERYQNRRLTSPEALMNYIEWDRGSGPMFEMSEAQRQTLNAKFRDLPSTMPFEEKELAKQRIAHHFKYDTTKRFRMWESGLGAAVLRKAYADAKSGKVDVQQFGAFVKSQPTPVAKLARGVTFMPITQWFKGMMECFAQNQRVTWRTTYIGKNMPGGQHMREFFEKVRVHPVLGEGDATQMDSRFEAGILYGLGRIAHHAWTWGSPNVINGAAIASHKAERYRALADGWIFNLHVSGSSGLKPRFHLVNALNRTYEGNPVEVKVGGTPRFYYTRDPELMSQVRLSVEKLRAASFAADATPTLEEIALDIGVDHSRLRAGARADPSINARPGLNNVTQKIRGGATGLEDTTDLNTDGKKIGTIAALVTFGRMIGHPISVADAMDESKYLEAHTSDDNIFGVDPLRLYGITPEEFAGHREEFMRAFAENNLNMTFLFHEGEHDGVRGRYLEYLSYFSRPLTRQDRLDIARVNRVYNHLGIYGPDKPQQELLDPLSGLPPSSVVYINTKAMDQRQTAQNAYKQHDYRDRYLLGAIQRDVGQAQLKAFNFESYCQNLSSYHTNALRYLAAGLEPQDIEAAKAQGVFGVGRHPQTRVPQVPRDPRILEWLESFFQRSNSNSGEADQTYAHYVLRSTVHRSGIPASFGRGVPAEFVARLKTLSLSQFPAYNKIVYDHFKKAHTPPDKAERIWKKINKGITGPDEAGKEILDDIRRIFAQVPKKFTKGVSPTLEMVYPDEIFTGSGRVEASVYLAYEQTCLDSNTMPTASGFTRLINQSPYAGVCNPAAAFHEFQTPEGSRKLHEHPAWVYRNATVGISIAYGFTWFAEAFIMGLPYIGLFWGLLMFYLIDITKVYTVLGLVRWHTIMAADPYISGLLPRDVYIHSKRFADWSAGFVPIEVFYVLQFHRLLDPLSIWVSYMARAIQAGTHTAPMTSSTPGHIQNEWEPIASTLLDLLYSLEAAGKTIVASVKGPTGTGKSTFLAYALMRLNLMERGGRCFLVAPFTVLRDDWSLPSFFAMGSHDTPEHEKASRYQILKGNVSMRANATMFLATYGHFQQHIQSGEITAKDLVLLDEGHLGGPAQVQVHKLLEKNRIPFIYLSATPAPVKGLDQGELVDATPVITQRNQKLVVLFPDSTPQISMYQQMRESRDKDPKLGYSHREMSERCIIKVNTLAAIQQTIAGLEELRKSDKDIPMAFEFSRNTFKAQKEEREAYCNGGRYIIVATDIIGVGYDIKPAAYSIIDNGLTIQEHQGFLQRPMNSTRDQMEQFHGRVGRNSSDRNGLVYCTENAGTGSPAQQYGSGSYYVDKEICEAIGVPHLQPLPYQGCNRDFNFFDVKSSITGPLRAGLVFTFFAALSGVDPREMSVFYRRYAELGFTLPEEYEWLSARMKASGQTMFQLPAWSVINTVIIQNPYIVSVERNAIVGREDGPERGLSFVGPIYPRAGRWMSFYELSNSKNTVTVTAKITSESEAFEAMREEMEKTIKDLRDKLVKRRANNGGNKNYGSTFASGLKEELDLRNAQSRYSGVTAAQKAMAEIDRLKPAIAASVARQASLETSAQLWDAGQAIARSKLTLSPLATTYVPPKTTAAVDAVKALAESYMDEDEDKFMLPDGTEVEPERNAQDSRKALEAALASLTTPAKPNRAARKKEERSTINGHFATWMQQTKSLNNDDASFALECWETRKVAICMRLDLKDQIRGLKYNANKGKWVMQWMSDDAGPSKSN